MACILANNLYGQIANEILPNFLPHFQLTLLI